MRLDDPGGRDIGGGQRGQGLPQGERAAIARGGHLVTDAPGEVERRCHVAGRIVGGAGQVVEGGGPARGIGGGKGVVARASERNNRGGA
jgi:hypothetical protein